MGNRENKRRKNDWLIGEAYAGKETVIKSGAEEKFHASRGHGFAAEQANNLFDEFLGKDAEVVGDDNKKNGADRRVNGVDIQSKYCASGSRCVNECFRDGEFRYYLKDRNGNYIRDSNGLRKHMQIEVPADKYDAAIESMNEKIKAGKGPDGVKDAHEIIRKGHFNYETVKNIAKAGTIESLAYDAANGIIIGASSGGISAAMTFAVAMWNGKSFDEALEQSVAAGLQTGGLAWASTILVGQMTKAGVNSLLVNSSEAVFKLLGNKATSTLANFLRQEAIKKGAKEIGSAAATKYMAKLLRGNVVTGLATVLVMSAGDIFDIFRGRISGGQFVKNAVNTSANVGGGLVGWQGGAVLGTEIGSAVPGIGNVVGSFVGALLGAIIGGWAAGKASQKVTDKIIEDDAKEMIRVFENEWKVVAVDFLLNKDEQEQVKDALTEKLKDGSKLKDMYASDNRPKFARELLESCAESVVRKRKKISLPSTQDYVRGLRNVLEKVADGEQSGRSPKKYYSTKIVGIGGEVSHFIDLVKMLVLFDETKVLPELREFSVLHSGNKLTDVIKPGDVLKIGENEFKILNVGNEVNNGIKSYGHTVIKFNDDKDELLEGSLHVEDKPIQKLRIGDEIAIISLSTSAISDRFPRPLPLPNAKTTICMTDLQ